MNDRILTDIEHLLEMVEIKMSGVIVALQKANEINERRADLDLRMVNIHIQALELARERVK